MSKFFLHSRNVLSFSSISFSWSSELAELHLLGVGALEEAVEQVRREVDDPLRLERGAARTVSSATCASADLMRMRGNLQDRHC